MTDILYMPMVVNGRPYEAERRLAVLNPATEDVVAEVPRASREDLDAAVEAARRAFAGWRKAPLVERQAAVAAMSALIGEHVEELASLLVAEQGKPLHDAKREILRASMMCRDVSTLAPPATVLEDSGERRIELRYVPLGVVGAISPWNFPVFLPMWKVACAVLAGNAVVLKTSPFTPLTMLRIASLVQEALPPGVFNVVTGGDELGPWVTEHEGIDKISFTGSSATGRKVMASASGTLKRVTLELGGNDAAVVLDDADLEQVVPSIFWAAFSNSGQICMAAKRVYVQAGIYDQFRDAFAAYARTVRVGSGMEEGVKLGPIQNRPQYERVQELIEDARAQGLTFLTGNEDAGPGNGKGYFVPITIIDNPPDDARVVTEEAFGPVLPLLRFSTEEEVIRRVNDTPYGLSGSVWTRDPERGRTLAEQFEVGTTWVNEALYLTPFMPFCGHKQSGVGVEGGVEGLVEYMNAQTLVIRNNRQSMAAA